MLEEDIFEVKQFKIFAIVYPLGCAILQELSLQVDEHSSFTVKQASTLIIDLISHMKSHVNEIKNFINGKAF